MSKFRNFMQRLSLREAMVYVMGLHLYHFFCSLTKLLYEFNDKELKKLIESVLATLLCYLFAIFYEYYKQKRQSICPKCKSETNKNRPNCKTCLNKLN